MTSADDDSDGGIDCSVCVNVSAAQVEALATYDNGGKQIVCDPACVDGVSDPTHCNCEYGEPCSSVVASTKLGFGVNEASYDRDVTLFG